jgi:hypothetical protein
MSAAAVAGGDRPAHPVRDGAGLAPDVQWLPEPAQHDRDDRGVAAEPAQLGGMQGAAVVEAGGVGPVL